MFSLYILRVKLLLDKTAKTVFHGFIESVKESKRHPNKQCVGQRREIYNNLTQN